MCKGTPFGAKRSLGLSGRDGWTLGMTTELEAIEALTLGDDEKFFQILGETNNGRCFDFTKVERELDYSLAHCCHKFLWNVEPQIVIRPSDCVSSWNEEAISANISSLPSKASKPNSVYLLNSRSNSEEAWIRRYVGSSKDLRQRMGQHLVKLGRARSCFERVKELVCQRQEEIAISWIQIWPAVLYEGIEGMIIGLEKSWTTGALEWNKEPGTRTSN